MPTVELTVDLNPFKTTRSGGCKLVVSEEQREERQAEIEEEMGQGLQPAEVSETPAGAV